MPTEWISGVKVYFPYELYSLQKAYMSKVLECLLHGKHGVLESPTGTGKTLSLLCSSLAWLNRKKEELRGRGIGGGGGGEGGAGSTNDDTDVIIINLEDEGHTWGNNSTPKIIYASRTHTQLSHVMMELRSTIYDGIKKTVLGSRDQLCIHPTVSKQEFLSMKNTLCRLHMKEKSCKFGNNIEKKKHEIISQGIVDIEDLVKKSSKASCCPYYMAKELQESADIIFMPYNYLLDPQIRKSLNVKLDNAVIILDEAHNVEKICEEASSISILSSDISSAVEEITHEMNEMYRLMSEGGSSSELQREYCGEELCNLKESFQKLERTINALQLNLNTERNSHKGSYIFDILKRADFTSETVGDLISLALKVSDTLVMVNNNSGYSKSGASLRKLAESLLGIFSSLGSNHDLAAVDFNFKVYLEEEIIKKGSSDSWLSKLAAATSGAKKVNYWCFNPGFGMSGLMLNNIHCVILTSGTLSPIQATIKELGLHEPVVLENPHIIKPSQVLITVVPKGPRNIELNSSFQNRHNDDYWHELGLSLQNFSRIIPHGVLIFFPSYTTMNKALMSWQNSGLWQKINSCKPIYVEPQNKHSLNSVVQDYRDTIDNGNGKGAILIGVCRGKISEGFDFTNQYCRGVLITGIPFPPLNDPRINLKKVYINEANKMNKNMSGEVWYQCEAIKAVNQAIGRVIRHSGDFGAILLCDVRFGNMSVVRYLSKWLRPYVRNLKTFGESISTLRDFFRENSKFQVQERRAQLNISTIKEQRVKKPLSETSINEVAKTAMEIEQFNQIYKRHSSINPSDSQPSTSRCSQTQSQTGLTSIYNSSFGMMQNQKIDKYEHPATGRFNAGNQDFIIKNSFIDVQPAKKRKVKLMPIQFELTTGSTAPNDLAHQKRINEVKDFICEVKQTLDAKSYTTFSSVVKKYQKSQCYDEILSSLKILFPKEDESLRLIFKGCVRFFAGKHKETFQKYCEENNI